MLGAPPGSRRLRPRRFQSRLRRRPAQSYLRRRLTQPCRRLRPFPKPQSCTGRATSRASWRSQPPPLTRPSDRRSNGRLCALTHTRPSRRSPLSLRLIPAGQAAAGFRERQEAELAAHPLAPAQVAAFFAGEPPQSSAGKIAAARAAQATGRAEEASQIIRALWREGSFDALTESVILREFGASLTKADHAYRADRLLYTGYLSAGARAAALAGPDVLALAQARIGAARAPVSPGAHQGGSAGVAQRSWSPVLQDPVRPPRGACLRGGGPAEPRAARSRRARQSGSMVERAEDGRPRAARPRRAATCV